MAFRASNQIPAENYQRSKDLANQLKRQAQTRSATFASGAKSAEILAAADHLNAFKTELIAMSQTPGIVAFAKEQEDDPTYDVVAEFTALLATIDAVIAEIVSTLPADTNDWLLINKINADGSLAPRSFTGAQLSGLRSLMDDIANAVS